MQNTDLILQHLNELFEFNSKIKKKYILKLKIIKLNK